MCDDGEHTCFHGSKCIDKGDTFTCNCQVGVIEFGKFAGQYCEHNVTSDCVVNQTLDHEIDIYAFCVNDGKCEKAYQDQDSNYFKCNCPDAWTG